MNWVRNYNLHIEGIDYVIGDPVPQIDFRQVQNFLRVCGEDEENRHENKLFMDLEFQIQNRKSGVDKMKLFYYVLRDAKQF